MTFMRLRKDELLSFFITAVVFGGLYAAIFGLPTLPHSMGAGESSNILTSKKSIATKVAQPIDNLNGVNVYYNGKVSNVTGRHIAPDGYNLGLKYQCVEFIKRYYYEYYSHRMPDSYGHAKDFYDPSIADGLMNRSRDLRQFTNGSISRPRTGDILIFGPTPTNKYGHIGIVSKSGRNKIEMIHQNSGPKNSSRSTYKMKKSQEKWFVANDYVLGWLRRS